MTLLGKSAAVATIVAAVFTVVAYFSSDRDRTTMDVPPVPVNNHENETKALKQQSQEIDENKASKKLDLTITEAEIKTRYKAAMKIPGTTTKTGSLRELAELSADLGYFDTAFDIALNIPSTTTKSSTLRYVSLRIAQSGDIEFAITVADRIPGTSTKTSTLDDISRM